MNAQHKNLDKAPSRSPWNVPNILTIVRILLVPIFGVLAFEGRHDWYMYLSALLVFCVAAYTDRLDGKLARKYGQITNFGKIADPFADKALMLTAFVVLAIMGDILWWFTIIVAIREIAVTVLRFVLLRRGRVVPASQGGKVKTVLQILLVVLVMSSRLVEHFSKQVGVGLGYASALVLVAAFAVTVITGVLYFTDAYSENRKSRQAQVRAEAEGTRAEHTNALQCEEGTAREAGVTREVRVVRTPSPKVLPAPEQKWPPRSEARAGRTHPAPAPLPTSPHVNGPHAVARPEVPSPRTQDEARNSLPAHSPTPSAASSQQPLREVPGPRTQGEATGAVPVQPRTSSPARPQRAARPEEAPRRRVEDTGSLPAQQRTPSASRSQQPGREGPGRRAAETQADMPVSRIPNMTVPAPVPQPAEADEPTPAPKPTPPAAPARTTPQHEGRRERLVRAAESRVRAADVFERVKAQADARKRDDTAACAAASEDQRPTLTSLPRLRPDTTPERPTIATPDLDASREWRDAADVSLWDSQPPATRPRVADVEDRPVSVERDGEGLLERLRGERAFFASAPTGDDEQEQVGPGGDEAQPQVGSGGDTRLRDAMSQTEERLRRLEQMLATDSSEAPTPTTPSRGGAAANKSRSIPPAAESEAPGVPEVPVVLEGPALSVPPSAPAAPAVPAAPVEPQSARTPDALTADQQAMPAFIPAAPRVPAPPAGPVPAISGVFVPGPPASAPDTAAPHTDTVAPAADEPGFDGPGAGPGTLFVPPPPPAWDKEG